VTSKPSDSTSVNPGQKFSMSRPHVSSGMIGGYMLSLHPFCVKLRILHDLCRHGDTETF
jgi:hypothetical protein